MTRSASINLCSVRHSSPHREMDRKVSTVNPDPFPPQSLAFWLFLIILSFSVSLCICLSVSLFASLCFSMDPILAPEVVSTLVLASNRVSEAQLCLPMGVLGN